MRELYVNEITDPSLKEFEEFAKWYNEKLGNYPIIVGGWAVYCYTRGLGSKDIDVVFLGDEAKHMTLFDYFRSHGFSERRKSFFDKEFVKTIKTKDQEIDIIIDAVSSNRTIIFEGKKARIPWNWAVKYSIKYKLEKATIYIPTIELLFVYKLGAILGRTSNLRTGLDIAYYRSKLWKDVYDIATLSRLKIDSKKLNKFLTDSNLADYKDDILQAIEDNFDQDIKSLVPDVSLLNIKKVLGVQQ